MDQEKIKAIEEEARKLLDALGVKTGTTVATEENGVIQFGLETEDSGMLIGYHGETLVSLELIFNLIIYKKFGEWTKIVFNVGDWRQRREENLKKMALRIAEQVEENGESVVCPYLSASERRIVHLALQDHLGVITESEGEGGSRRLVVKLKS